MTILLNNTENPVNRLERIKINENWERIVKGLTDLQQQILVLAGGAAVDELIERLNEAIDNANTAVQQAIDANNVATQEAIEANNTALQSALDTVSQTLVQMNEAITKTNTATTEANAAKQGALDATTQAQATINKMQSMIDNLRSIGVWDVATQYYTNNIVTYNNNSYIALQDNIGRTPPTLPLQANTYWSLLAGQGLKGDRGEKGDTGAALSIIDKLTDVSQLPPIGVPGDAYSVNGDLYVWSEALQVWENLGNIKGEKGDKGDTGAEGESAYQVALDNGFSGTEAEWLASLKGEKGDTPDLTQINQKVDGLQTTVTNHTGNNEIHVTKAKQDKWDKVTSKADYIAIDKAVGGVYPDPNTLLDSVFITNHINAQSNGDVDKFWYIEQVFLNSADSVSYSRSQIARSYLGANADMKVRHFYNGVWSPWSPSIQSITTLPAPVNAALGTGWSVRPNYYLKYYKDAFGIVRLYGRVDRNGGGTLITTLPVGYRPIENFETGVTQGVTGHAYIEIFPDGRVNAPSGVADNTNVLIECSFRTT